MPKRIPPTPIPPPQGDDYQRVPEFARGADEATTGPRDIAKLVGGTSTFIPSLPDPSP